MPCYYKNYKRVFLKLYETYLDNTTIFILKVNVLWQFLNWLIGPKIVKCKTCFIVRSNGHYNFLLFTWMQKYFIEDGSGDASQRPAVVGEREATVKKNSKHEKHSRTDRGDAENIRNVQVYIFFQRLKQGLLLTDLSSAAWAWIQTKKQWTPSSSWIF